MKWINAVLVILAVLLCSSARAEEPAVAEQPGVGIFTFEDTSCGAWAKSAKHELGRAQYESWFRGFVSGYNFWNQGNQVKRLPEGETFALYVDKYCRENPLEEFTLAVFGLIRELRDDQPPQAARKSDPK